MLDGRSGRVHAVADALARAGVSVDRTHEAAIATALLQQDRGERDAQCTAMCGRGVAVGDLHTDSRIRSSKPVPIITPPRTRTGRPPARSTARVTPARAGTLSMFTRSVHVSIVLADQAHRPDCPGSPRSHGMAPLAAHAHAPAGSGVPNDAPASSLFCSGTRGSNFVLGERVRS